MSTFDYLTGSIRVKAPAPEAWADLYELPFWEDPNNGKWGKTLCRILYHETVHFWQLLSSGYLANLITEDWVRLLEYEKTGRLLPESDKVRQYTRHRENISFTNRELVETWARYWDVHTRSPASIIKEEKLDEDSPESWEIHLNGSASPVSYTNDAFDMVMQTGPDCKTYGRPYRWLLEKFNGHSAFVAVFFPIITHAAFGSPDPAVVFCNSFERAWNSEALRARLNKRSGNINFDWLNLWPSVLNEAVYPSLEEKNFPPYTSGRDVIERGPLNTHPIFEEYLHKIMVKGFLNTYKPVAGGQDKLDLLEAEAMAGAPMHDPMIPFALPGQPFYRRMLGILAPPPSIKFDNFTWSAHRPAVLKFKAAEEGKEFEDSFVQISVELAKRVQRLRAAEKAVSLGLPANAFEEKDKI